MNDFLFPRTLRGWKNLLLLTLRRCPQCYGSLLRDSVLYDDGQTVFCPPCGYAMLPRGFFNALRWNARASAEASKKERA